MSFKQQSGFTIVELLIVIVVIAILATISIVAYTGIQDRARASAASTAASQAARKVAIFYAQEARLPADLDEAGFSDSEQDKLEYSSNPAATPNPTYCITATEGTISYYINNTTATSPTEGGCPGHSVGGQPASIVSSTVSNWEAGHYHQNNGEKSAQAGRIRYVDLVAVTPGATYTQTTGNSSYQFVIRYYNQSQSIISSAGAIATGATLTIPNNAHYMGVSIYNPSSSNISLAAYQEYLSDGTLSPSIRQN